MKLLMQFLVFSALLLAGAYVRTQPMTIGTTPAHSALPHLRSVSVSPPALRLATGAKYLVLPNKKPL